MPPRVCTELDSPGLWRATGLPASLRWLPALVGKAVGSLHAGFDATARSSVARPYCVHEVVSRSSGPIPRHIHTRRQASLFRPVQSRASQRERKIWNKVDGRARMGANRGTCERVLCVCLVDLLCAASCVTRMRRATNGRPCGHSTQLHSHRPELGLPPETGLSRIYCPEQRAHEPA